MPLIRSRVFFFALLPLGLGLACADNDASPVRKCNGRADLCDRPFNRTVFPGTHNSMSNADASWVAANQQHGLTRQLEDGIRVMLLDTHYWKGGAYFCHSICEFGHQPLEEGLGEIKSFMDAHPDEVLAIIFEDGISPADTASAFESTGLVKFVFTHEPGSSWPTLGEMIDSGGRLLITAENQGPPPAWYQHVWDMTFDNPYSYTSIDQFSCTLNRGSASNDLFLLNHWIGNPLPNPAASTTANRYEVLKEHADRCRNETGRIINFVAVDYYSIGDLFRVVNELNDSVQ